MSRSSVIAGRYGRALFEAAQAHGIVSEAEEQLRVSAEALQGDALIAKFLDSPNVADDRKIELIRQALTGKVADVVLNTVDMLIRRGRIGELNGVYEAYSKAAGEALGRADAVVYSAIELSEAELTDIAARFGTLIGKQIRARQIVQPELLGGIRVRIGNRLYDGSLAGKLGRMEQALKSKAL
ncbi:ATP synthase F1 subunit delta [Paenibacillus sp. IB182496]|uniref:ATP synthase subunit delta n=1 Tax=Paenibacillus sabuli TaxID=2772509 RepID=A0A927BSC7_9BACL|nr:ATP synthase F1 subunit delta [Paenibacillus sabuli]MBD2845891.1 ATP synthase F1 subunit delta [Paenibacillus sabuli]